MNVPVASVYIVDDNANIRDALSFLVSSVGFSAETFSSPEDFFNRQPTELCGCVVSDMRMPGMSGLELQRVLNDQERGIPIIFVTGHGDTKLAVAAMREGAWDFMEKPYRDQDLLDSINHALKEGARVRAGKVKKQRVQQCLDSLTPRELDVLALILDGNANKVIAQDLGINERTVETHRANVMEKMGTRSLAQLIRRVLLAKLGADQKLTSLC